MDRVKGWNEHRFIELEFEIHLHLWSVTSNILLLWGILLIATTRCHLPNWREDKAPWGWGLLGTETCALYNPWEIWKPEQSGGIQLFQKSEQLISFGRGLSSVQAGGGDSALWWFCHLLWPGCSVWEVKCLLASFSSVFWCPRELGWMAWAKAKTKMLARTSQPFLGSKGVVVEVFVAKDSVRLGSQDLDHG